MNKITKFAFTYLLLFSCFIAVAQAPEKGGERMLATLSEQLELSDDQYNQVKKYILSQRESINAVRAEEDLETSKKQSMLKDIRSKFDENMRSVLNDGQYERFKKIKEDRSTRRTDNMKKQKGPRPTPEAIAKKKAEMKERREIMEPKLRALRAEFDNEISRKDRKKIEKLRVVFDAHKEERKAAREKMKASKDRPSKEEMKKRVKHEHESIKAEKEELAELVKKYGSAIKTLFESNPEIQEFMNQRHKPNGRFAMGRDSDKQRTEKRKGKLAGLFLLMNPEK